MDKLDSVNLQGCGHALHYDCMSTLLGYQENTPCPMCRKPIEHDMLLDCNPSDFNARCHESAYEIEYGPQIMEVVARAGSATGGSKKKNHPIFIARGDPRLRHPAGWTWIVGESRHRWGPNDAEYQSSLPVYKIADGVFIDAWTRLILLWAPPGDDSSLEVEVRDCHTIRDRLNIRGPATLYSAASKSLGSCDRYAFEVLARWINGVLMYKHRRYPAQWNSAAHDLFARTMLQGPVANGMYQFIATACIHATLSQFSEHRDPGLWAFLRKAHVGSAHKDDVAEGALVRVLTGTPPMSTLAARVKKYRNGSILTPSALIGRAKEMVRVYDAGR